MAKVESNLTLGLTSQGALIAPLWTPNHTTANGNAYTIGTLVKYETGGVSYIYKCIADNDSIIPTNVSYWLNMGAGNAIQQEKPDWNATSGDSQILNKPLITNVDQNNKVIYFYPTLAELGVLTLEEVTETHIATWIQNEGILIAEDEIPLFKVKLELYPIYFDITNRSNEVGGWPPLENMELVKFYATKDYTTQNVINSTVYTDKTGNTIFVGDGNNYRFDLSPICSYGINSLGKITDIECLFE